MNKHLMIGIMLGIAATAVLADSKAATTYVGQGRYTCSGTSAACAQVDANNRNESARRDDSYQREQDRAQAAVERQRREQEKARRY